MRRYKTGSRWATPSRHYAGALHQNPWINAVLARSTTSLQDDAGADSEQKAAVRVWEDEGGSLGAHRRTC